MPTSRHVLIPLAFAATLALAGCLGTPSPPPPPADHTSPYVDLANGSIRALTPKEVGDLLNGSGMGLALAAELNGYPGPRHILDMADELELTPAQRAQVQELFTRMQTEAKRLGREVVDLHIVLEGTFRNATVTNASLRAMTENISLKMGELRFVHLSAHLEAYDLLTQHQNVRYQELRGYRETGSGGHPHSGGHDHSGMGH